MHIHSCAPRSYTLTTVRMLGKSFARRWRARENTHRLAFREVNEVDRGKQHISILEMPAYVLVTKIIYFLLGIHVQFRLHSISLSVAHSYGHKYSALASCCSSHMHTQYEIGRWWSSQLDDAAVHVLFSVHRHICSRAHHGKFHCACLSSCCVYAFARDRPNVMLHIPRFRMQAWYCDWLHQLASAGVCV